MASFLTEQIGFDSLVFGACIIIWYAMMLPFFIYYLHEYRKNANDSFIRPRHPHLSLISNYFLMILLFVIAPIQWAEIIYFESYNFGKLREYLFFIRVIWEQLSMWLRIVRYWHLWYKYHYQKYCALSVYIKAINLNAIRSNYFIRNKHTLGNMKFLLIIISIVWCIEIIFFIFIILISDNQRLRFDIITSIGLVFYFSQCVIFTILSITINKIRDTLYIRREVFYESIAASFCCLILCVILICFNLNKYALMEDRYFVTLIVFIIPGFICYPLMIGVTSFWVYLKMRYQYRKQRQLESGGLDSFGGFGRHHDENTMTICNIPSHSMTMDTISNINNLPHPFSLKPSTSKDSVAINEDSMMTNNTMVTSPRNDNISMTLSKLDFVDDKIDPRLKAISFSSGKSPKKISQSIQPPPINKAPFLINKFLPNQIGFELFAEHLIKEYAIENLLFLIEVEKFKRNCLSIYGDDIALELRELPKSLPPSIGLQVFDNKLKLQFCVLYHKYIDSYKAEFSVNVASRNRLICQQLYNEWYDIAHGLNDGYYDTTTDFEDEDEAYSNTPHLSPKVNSPKISVSRLQKGFGTPISATTSISNITITTSSVSCKPKLSMKRMSSSNSNASSTISTKRRSSFPTTKIIGFRSKDSNKDQQHDQDEHKELKKLKEETPEIKESELDITGEQEQSATKTISILPANKNTNTNRTDTQCSGGATKSNRLSVTSYHALPIKSRLSTTMTATTPSHLNSQQYPPHLTININDHSFETNGSSMDQLTIYEPHTDNECSPAPPNFLTPQVTPQGTPYPDHECSQTENTNTPHKTDKLSLSTPPNASNPIQPQPPQSVDTSKLSAFSYSHALDPLTPLALSPPISRRPSRELSALPDDDTVDAEETKRKHLRMFSETESKNPSVNKILSIDSVTSQSISNSLEESVVSKSSTINTSATSTMSHGSDIQSISGAPPHHHNHKMQHHYVKVNVSEEPTTTMSKSWSVDGHAPNTKLPPLKFGDSCDLDQKSDARKMQKKPLKKKASYPMNKRSISSNPRFSFQKRQSTSLLSMGPKMPRSQMNQRIEEMMFLMSENERNSSSAQEILDKYKDDVEDTQAMIDALDNCLKDVMANLRDSFGRFIFSDAYRRWSEDD